MKKNNKKNRHIMIKKLSESEDIFSTIDSIPMMNQRQNPLRRMKDLSLNQPTT